MGEFRMPSLGADMDEGTLVEWLVAPGDSVHRGDIVAVVDTAKSAIEIEVFEDGVVTELLVPTGTTVPVGTAIARLGGAATPRNVSVEGGHGVTQLTQSGADEPAEPSSTHVTAEPETPHEPAVASPIVRHLAHEKGVDLSTVYGSGPDGAVTRADVEAADVPAAAAAETASNVVVHRPHEGGELTRSEDGGRVRASPFARRRASELGVDLGTVTGTGPDGAITVADVEGAATTSSPTRRRRPPPTTRNLSDAMASLNSLIPRRGWLRRLHRPRSGRARSRRQCAQPSATSWPRASARSPTTT